MRRIGRAMAGLKAGISDVKWLGLFLGLFVLPWIVLFVWFGLVPWVADLFGSRAPQNLGVKYAAADLKRFEAKAGVKLGAPPPALPVAPASPGQPPRPAPQPPAAPKPVDMTLSQEELSAALNSLGARLLPLRDVQVRLGPGAMELSGALDGSRLGDFLKTVGVREKDAESITRWVGALGDNLPVYAKAVGGVENGELSAQLQRLQVGGLDIPREQLDRIAKNGFHASLGTREGYAVQTLTLQAGALRFIGALPPNLGASRAP